MANYTTNLHLEKPEYNETADIEIINQNMEKIDSEMTYKIATGTGTEIKLSLPETFGNGYNTTFIASANNGASATTVNGKPLYKPNTTTPPNVTSGKAYTIWYNEPGDCFFLKASAEGNAPQSSVLAGATFSNDNDTGLMGTMNDLRSKNVYCGAEGVALLNVYSGNSAYGQLKITPSPNQKPNGYADHTTTFETHLLNLIPSNIKAGVSIAGKMTGTFTNDATAQAGHILSGFTAYVNGNKVTGNIANQPSQVNANSFGVNGNNGYVRIPKGAYLNPAWNNFPEIVTPFSMIANVIGLTPNKLVSGNNVLGVQGNATIESLGGKRFVGGTITVPRSNPEMQISVIKNVQYTYTTKSVMLSLTGHNIMPSFGIFYETNLDKNFSVIILIINSVVYTVLFSASESRNTRYSDVYKITKEQNSFIEISNNRIYIPTGLWSPYGDKTFNYMLIA